MGIKVDPRGGKGCRVSICRWGCGIITANVTSVSLNGGGGIIGWAVILKEINFLIYILPCWMYEMYSLNLYVFINKFDEKMGSEYPETWFIGASVRPGDCRVVL